MVVFPMLIGFAAAAVVPEIHNVAVVHRLSVSGSVDSKYRPPFNYKVVFKVKSSRLTSESPIYKVRLVVKEPNFSKLETFRDTDWLQLAVNEDLKRPVELEIFECKMIDRDGREIINLSHPESPKLFVYRNLNLITFSIDIKLPGAFRVTSELNLTPN